MLNVLKAETNIVLEENRCHDTVIVLQNGIYQLELHTLIFDEALKTEWIEYGFLSPLILNQYLIFYKNGKIYNISASHSLFSYNKGHSVGWGAIDQWNEKSYKYIKNNDQKEIFESDVFMIDLLDIKYIE